MASLTEIIELAKNIDLSVLKDVDLSILKDIDFSKLVQAGFVRLLRRTGDGVEVYVNNSTFEELTSEGLIGPSPEQWIELDRVPAAVISFQKQRYYVPLLNLTSVEQLKEL